MDRRTFCAGLASELLVVASGAGAQAAAGAARLGILVGGVNPRTAPFYVAFERRLGELGWVDGRNLVIDFHSNVDVTRAAESLVRNKSDVIVAVGPEAGVKAASAATKSIPIVMVALNYDPIE